MSIFYRNDLVTDQKLEKRLETEADVSVLATKADLVSGKVPESQLPPKAGLVEGKVPASQLPKFTREDTLISNLVSSTFGDRDLTINFANFPSIFGSVENTHLSKQQIVLQVIGGVTTLPTTVFGDSTGIDASYGVIYEEKLVNLQNFCFLGDSAYVSFLEIKSGTYGQVIFTWTQGRDLDNEQGGFPFPSSGVLRVTINATKDVNNKGIQNLDIRVLSRKYIAE